VKGAAGGLKNRLSCPRKRILPESIGVLWGLYPSEMGFKPIFCFKAF
jgi:hypothetical protein